jgi:DNA-binding NarL/FixJ family response regulator
MVMGKRGVTALIIGRVSPLRDSLTELVGMMSAVRLAQQIDGNAAALETIERDHPALVLMEVGLAHADAGAFFRQVKRVEPAIQCVALGHSVEALDTVGGADGTLLTGMPVTALLETIGDLLPAGEK